MKDILAPNHENKFKLNWFLWAFLSTGKPSDTQGVKYNYEIYTFKIIKFVS